MNDTVTMLAKHYSPKLLDQILFIKVVGESINELESKVISNCLKKYEVGVGSDE